MKMKTKVLSWASMLAASLAVPWPAAAQSAWPEKPVMLVVPYSAGGPTDVVARMLAIPMGKSLGQTVVVENTVGAGGTIAPARVARAQPNGYTILIHHMGMATAPALYKKLPYDPLKDFDLIGNIVMTPQVLVVGPNAPYKSVKDLVAAAKAKPGEIAYASLGNGSTSHLTMEAFQAAAGIKLNHIPFKGSGDAQAQLIGGQIPLMSDTIPGVRGQIAAGKLRPIGLAITKRSEFLPDTPTIHEQGYAGFESVGWIGLAAPAGTPAPILDKLNAEIRKMLGDPAVKARFQQLAFEPVGDSRKEFTEFVRNEIRKWTKVVKESGATIN